MAVAEQIQRIEVVEQEVAVEEYVLTLSAEEASFVLNYLGHTVTGFGLREHSDNVCGALEGAGVKFSYDFPNSFEGGVQRNNFKRIQGGY